MISGLPGDDETTLTKSLEEICKIKPSHISLYSLTIEDETPFGKQYNSGKLVYDFDQADKLWLYGRDYLETQGYKWYEVSNFCLEGKECRHNLAYWTHSDYLGCGSGGTGTVYKADASALRWTNTTDINKYISFWNFDGEGKIINGNKINPAVLAKLSEVQAEEKIDSEISEFEFFMMELRKTDGFEETQFKRFFSKALPEKFLCLFEKWEKKGLCVRQKVEGSGVRYFMSREGMLFLNRFLEELC